MPHYRVYFLDRGEHISGPAEVIEANDDDEATQKAAQFIDGKDIELWHEKRFVARFPRK